MALVRSILNLSSTLRLDTVAEGIETPVQREALRGLGAQRGQGYLFARPMGPDDLRDLLAGTEPTAPAADAHAHASAIRLEAPEPSRPGRTTRPSHPAMTNHRQRGSLTCPRELAVATVAPAPTRLFAVIVAVAIVLTACQAAADPPRTITLADAERVRRDRERSRSATSATGPAVEITVDPGGNLGHAGPHPSRDLRQPHPAAEVPAGERPGRRLEDRRSGARSTSCSPATWPSTSTSRTTTSRRTRRAWTSASRSIVARLLGGILRAAAGRRRAPPPVPRRRPARRRRSSVTITSAPGETLAFDPAETTVRAAGPIAITFRNGSSLAHNLVFTAG